jgi:hypothetical protein
MAQGKYPREPLAMLRAKESGDAAVALAEAVRAREEAERVARSIERVRDRAADAARAVRDAEASALERGELRVVDLERAGAWSARVERDRVQTESRVARSAERVRAAGEAEEVARASVAGAHASAKVTERDRARWEDGARRAALARDEEDTSEAWRKS